MSDPVTDPKFLFLEDDENEDCVSFVKQQNSASTQKFCDQQFETDRELVLDILESDDRLIIPRRRKNWLYDFQRTQKNPRGIWQRIRASEELTHDAQWETVFDLDEFCRTENSSWVWFGAETAYFDPDKVLLVLSDGGSDRVRFVEFDCQSKCIVPGGFDMAPAKASISWLDPDTVLLSSSAGEGHATLSGWPRTIRQAKRGQDPYTSPVIFQGKETDIFAHGVTLRPDEGEPFIVVTCRHQLLETSSYILKGTSKLERLNTPGGSIVQCNSRFYAYFTRNSKQGEFGQLLFQPISENAHSKNTHRHVFYPTEKRALDEFLLLNNWLVWTASDNLRPLLFILDLSDPAAKPVQIDLPATGEMINIFPLDAETQIGDDTLQILIQGQIQPPTLYHLKVGEQGAAATLLKIMQSPDRFDACGMTTQVFEARSDDGTLIPYHITLPAHYEQNKGEVPVLMYGYGGYEISVKPFYASVTGKLWCERGGAHVIAHIRGGGEFGPGWHQAAIKENRLRSYEDFAAIATDLVRRGITTSEKIACSGSSNGGLLCGVMLTRYPELFGAIWPSVPVLDMLRFHELPAGQAWINEYGNPDKETDKVFLKEYSPLHSIKNVSECIYPPVYIDNSTNDDRVHPSHARRMTAALLQVNQDVAYHEFDTGGHGGSGATHDQAQRWAMGFRFLNKILM